MSARVFRLALAPLLLALALGGCTGNDPILVGFAGQLTGQFSDLGVQGRNGAQLAVEELNAAGGIHGRPLELVAVDDLNTPEGAVAADRELLAKGVVAVIGHMTSSQTMAALPEMEARQAILVSPTTAAPELAGRPDRFFRVIPTNTRWAEDLARHALDREFRRAFLVGDGDNVSYTDTFLKIFTRRYLEGGGVINGRRIFSSRDGEDWQALAETIRAAAPSVVIACMSARDLAALARALHPGEQGIRVMGPTWPSTNDLLVLGGKDVEGFTFATNFTEDNPRPEFTGFRERYRQRFGWPATFAAAYAYEAVSLLAHALETTGGRRAGLEAALVDGRELPGIIGPFRLDPYGDVHRETRLIKVRNGAYVTMTSPGGSP